MSGSRQKTRHQPTRMSIERGEAPIIGNTGAEPLMAVMEPESPAATMMSLVNAQPDRTAVVRTRMPGGVGGAAP